MIAHVKGIVSEKFNNSVEVEKDTSGVEEALDAGFDQGQMDELLRKAEELVQAKKDSPDFKARLEEIARQAEIAKKTPMGTSPQYTELAKLLLEMGGPDVSTEMGRNMLRMSTQDMLDKARNAMRAERESFEDKVNHFVNMIVENDAFKEATNKSRSY
jgi:predicted ArsR family transcriptional regulator